jgi:lipopolysaccharide cholinephosphotransferase
MKTIKSQELKQIQLAILKDVHDFCEKENIGYFLAYGTLIGAVRHKGYIPWDDDIDIAMPRPDYERFFKTYRSSEYEALNCDNSIEHLYSFGKVYDKRTVLDEYIAFKQKTGVYIDVFPFDGVPKNSRYPKKIVYKIQYYVYIGNLKKNKIQGIKRSFIKQVLFVILQLPALFYSYLYVVRRVNELCMTYKYEDSEYVANLNANFIRAKQHLLKSDFDERILAEFEGYQFYIPKGYDKWLTDVYGDYMKEPPENERESTHKFTAWWKDSIIAK